MASTTPTDIASVKTELGMANIPDNDPRLLGAVEAANEYVLRYHEQPVDGAGEPAPFRADHRLGAARLAAGLYRDANKPGITDNGLGGMPGQQVYRRVTDVLIEQLLQIGRYAPPAVG